MKVADFHLPYLLWGAPPELGLPKSFDIKNRKHLKNVGPIRHCEPPHAHSPDVASCTVACRLRIDLHDNDDNDNDNA